MATETPSGSGRPGHDGSAATGAATGAATAARWTVRALLAWIVPFLKEREVDSPRIVAEVLLAEVLKVERLRLYMEPERELDPEELAALRALVARAGRHEPVQYLVGRWPFLGRDFEVAPCTLIPRPCTETLVEETLAWYRARGGGSIRALDLCTGTGCIAISVALGMRAIARPGGAGCKPIAAGRRAEARAESRAIDGAEAMHAEAGSAPAAEGGAATGAVEIDAVKIHVIATDIVSDAVELARRNALRLGIELDFRSGDLWSCVRPDERFGAIVSNPPYVTDDEYAALDRNVKEYEPATALRGGADGLAFIRRVVEGAERHLEKDGLLAVEIGWKHRDAALALVRGATWRDARVVRDGDGIDRVLLAIRG
jgi:release factor glutamine methyltransferase